jgi:hypothetical protein
MKVSLARKKIERPTTPQEAIGLSNLPQLDDFRTFLSLILQDISDNFSAWMGEVA